MEDEKRAAADRDLMVKRATYKTQINQASATAEVAFEIEKAKQGQMVRTVSARITALRVRRIELALAVKGGVRKN